MGFYLFNEPPSCIKLAELTQDATKRLVYLDGKLTREQASAVRAVWLRHIEELNELFETNICLVDERTSSER